MARACTRCQNILRVIIVPQISTGYVLPYTMFFLNVFFYFFYAIIHFNYTFMGHFNGYLMGDRYPCLTYLMTPYPEPEPGLQAQFNLAHSRTRVNVEMIIGILKGFSLRFQDGQEE